ncbi:MAG: ABC transporter permease, partial [Solirubrobacteraceae bacterium]
MFVAFRDLRFAKGRFALMGTVVALITLLVVLLSGLTAGLGRDSTSAITGLSANQLVFSAPAHGQGISFTESSISQGTLAKWRQVPGVRSAAPLGVATTKAQADGRSAALSAFGVQPDSRLAPDGNRIAAGQAVLSRGAANALDARAGQTVTLAGHRLTVAAVAGDASFSHTPVIWTSLADWQRLSPGSDVATVIALTTTPQAHLAAADQRLDTKTVTRAGALSAIGGYTSENTSLQLMRALLFAISALVIGAFFTVWTIQRSGEIAVLKALGA